MATKDNNLIVKRTAQELGIPEYEVWDVVRSVFQYIATMIESGTWEGFHLRGLGKLYVNPKRITARKLTEENKLIRQLKEEEDVRVNRLQSEDKPSDA